MPVLLRVTDGRYSFWCPGCKCGHHFDGRWQFNGDWQKPTFTAQPSSSLLIRGGPGPQLVTICHLFVTSGKILFCGDCPHSLKGQTVDMVDWDTIIGGNMQEETANAQAPAPAGTAAAPTPIDSAKTPPPHPGFDAAVAFVESRGYSHGAAVEIVNKEGIEKILASKAARDDDEEAAPGASTAAASEETKQEGPPEPGMKRCASCGIWYPGGYENCPHCNTKL